MARPHARSKPAEGNHLQRMAVFIGASNDLSQGVASKRGVGFHKNCSPSRPKSVLETRRSFLTTLLDEAVRPSFPSFASQKLQLAVSGRPRRAFSSARRRSTSASRSRRVQGAPIALV